MVFPTTKPPATTHAPVEGKFHTTTKNISSNYFLIDLAQCIGTFLWSPLHDLYHRNNEVHKPFQSVGHLRPSFAMHMHVCESRKRRFTMLFKTKIIVYHTLIIHLPSVFLRVHWFGQFILR